MVYIYVGVLNVNNKDIRSFNFASTSMYLKKAKLPEFRVAIKLKYKSIEGPKNEKMKLQNPMEEQRKAKKSLFFKKNHSLVTKLSHSTPS